MRFDLNSLFVVAGRSGGTGSFCPCAVPPMDRFALGSVSFRSVLLREEGLK